MRSVPLSSVAAVNPEGPEVVQLGPNQLMDFVPMASVSEAGTMTVSEQRPIAEMTKGFTPFRIRRAGERRMTGSAGQRRVPKAFLEELEIPLRPLAEQKRIADILDQVDQLRRKRRRSLALLEEIRVSYFNHCFAASSGSLAYKTARLGSLCELVRGSSPRPQGDPRFFGGPIPRLMIADITRDGMHVRPQIDTLTEEGAKRSRPMRAGSVVMAVSGAVGLPAILEIDACRFL
jgi:hypothetical protein